MLKINKLNDNFIEERAAKAKELFESGYNCCQSVVLAFEDLTDIDTKTLASLTSGFGGGFGRLREVCGTVSGMTFLSGIISPADNPLLMDARKANYSLVQKFAAEFKEINGSIVCAELLGIRPKSNLPESPMPSERTAEYYKKRPCAELVQIAARIVAKEISENRGE